MRIRHRICNTENGRQSGPGVSQWPAGRGPVEAHVCTVEPGRTHRERHWADRGPCSSGSPPPRCCLGTEARGLIRARKQARPTWGFKPTSGTRPAAQSCHQPREGWGWRQTSILAQAHSSSYEQNSGMYSVSPILPRTLGHFSAYRLTLVLAPFLQSPPPFSNSLCLP